MITVKHLQIQNLTTGMYTQPSRIHNQAITQGCNIYQIDLNMVSGIIIFDRISQEYILLADTSFNLSVAAANMSSDAIDLHASLCKKFPKGIITAPVVISGATSITTITNAIAGSHVGVNNVLKKLY